LSDGQHLIDQFPDVDEGRRGQLTAAAISTTAATIASLTSTYNWLACLEAQWEMSTHTIASLLTITTSITAAASYLTV